MTIGAFNPRDTSASGTRPTHVPRGTGSRLWHVDGGGLWAQDLNFIIAQFRSALDYFGVADSEADDTTLRQILVAAAPSSGFRNMLANGTFRVWQRGTSFVNPAAVYTADRWIHTRSGSPVNMTFSRVAHPTIPGRYGLRLQIVDPGTMTFCRISQRLENVGRCEGKVLTFAWDYVSNVSASVNSLFSQNFGTSGSPSGAVNFGTTSLAWANTGGALASLSLTATVPSIAGKTLGTDGNDFLSASIGFPIVACDVSIFDAQVNLGSVAQPFLDHALVSPALELNTCKRRFQRIGGNIADRVFGAGGADSTTHAFAFMPYDEMSGTPGVTANGGGTNFEVLRQGGAVVATTALSATAGRIGRSGCIIDATVAGGLTAGEYVMIKAKNTSGYIDLSTEL